jgi:hypothetical protein
MKAGLSHWRTAVVPVSAPSGEPLRADFERSRAPASSAKGRRTHSPGAASPSYVWLPIRLRNLEHIFGKKAPAVRYMESQIYSVLAGANVLTAGSNGMPPLAPGLGLRMPAIGCSRILPPWRVSQLVISG